MEITNYFLTLVRDNKRMYKDLLQYLIKNFNEKQLLQGVSEISLSLPVPLTSIDEFMSKITPEIIEQNLWLMDCARMYDYLYRKANEKFQLKDIYNEEFSTDTSYFGEQDFLVSLFIIVSFSFAYSSLIEPKLRKMIGIKKGWFR